MEERKKIKYKNKRRKRGSFWGNNGIFRFVIVAVLAVANIALGIVAVTVLSRSVPFINLLLLVAALFIICRKMVSLRTPDHTLAWSVLLLTVPVAGIVFFISWGNVNFTENEKGYLERSSERSRRFLQNEPDAAQALRAARPGQARQAAVLLRDGFPSYAAGAGAAKYYPAGESLFDDMFGDLERAGRSIFMCFYIIAKGNVLERAREILLRKAKEGVLIRLMYDDMGCMPTLGGDFAEELREAGVEVTVFNPMHRYVHKLYLNYRNHRKMCIVDGETAYVGGLNLADEYANIGSRVGHWKDTGLRFTGDAVRSQTAIFLQLWDMGNMKITQDYNDFLPPLRLPPANPDRPPTPGMFIVPFADGPANNPRNPAHTLYQTVCAAARERLWFTTPYLIPDCALREALCCAAEGGVDVRIVTPGTPDHVTIYAATRGHYRRLLESGVRIFEYSPGFMHAKMALCDDESAIVGSINMDSRSFYQHYENAVWVTGGRAVEAIRRDLEDVFAKSREIDLNAWEARPLHQKLWHGMMTLFSPLF